MNLRGVDEEIRAWVSTNYLEPLTGTVEDLPRLQMEKNTKLTLHKAALQGYRDALEAHDDVDVEAIMKEALSAAAS